MFPILFVSYKDNAQRETQSHCMLEQDLATAFRKSAILTLASINYSFLLLLIDVGSCIA